MFDALKRRFAGLNGTAPETGLGIGSPMTALVSGRPTLRDTLFADAMLDELLESLPAEAQAKEPFASFARAAEAWRKGHSVK